MKKQIALLTVIVVLMLNALQIEYIPVYYDGTPKTNKSLETYEDGSFEVWKFQGCLPTNLCGE